MNNAEPFGQIESSSRGFPGVVFEDAYGHDCSLQCSSVIGDYEDSFERPGTSAVWLGVNDANPQILARDAVQYGITTREITGWIPYPVPEGVLLTTRMHLNREQVRGLISRLQEWLDTGTFSNAKEPFRQN
jgi:hypothetical protein